MNILKFCDPKIVILSLRKLNGLRKHGSFVGKYLRNTVVCGIFKNIAEFKYVPNLTLNLSGKFD